MLSRYTPDMSPAQILQNLEKDLEQAKSQGQTGLIGLCPKTQRMILPVGEHNEGKGLMGLIRSGSAFHELLTEKFKDSGVSLSSAIRYVELRDFINKIKATQPTLYIQQQPEESPTVQKTPQPGVYSSDMSPAQLLQTLKEDIAQAKVDGRLGDMIGINPETHQISAYQKGQTWKVYSPTAKSLHALLTDKFKESGVELSNVISYGRLRDYIALVEAAQPTLYSQTEPEIQLTRQPSGDSGFSNDSNNSSPEISRRSSASSSSENEGASDSEVEVVATSLRSFDRENNVQEAREYTGPRRRVARDIDVSKALPTQGLSRGEQIPLGMGDNDAEDLSKTLKLSRSLQMERSLAGESSVTSKVPDYQALFPGGEGYAGPVSDDYSVYAQLGCFAVFNRTSELELNGKEYPDPDGNRCTINFRLSVAEQDYEKAWNAIRGLMASPENPFQIYKMTNFGAVEKYGFKDKPEGLRLTEGGQFTLYCLRDDDEDLIKAKTAFTLKLEDRLLKAGVRPGKIPDSDGTFEGHKMFSYRDKHFNRQGLTASSRAELEATPMYMRVQNEINAQ
ncbi:hypothetical protein [Parendozoicomonas haliclonae]|uniref:Phosphothreonine lyase OspF n=1 Tax=Parendozoicomonas haliclonae TaxID=1960125 RepID=A0A1X7AQG9_9GAMM|nr:hypothetical protein [Parendozoicomonas haliclonae]SMA50495.1 Phosphothreonine lyase OspF [Parendozoicomonas haliclonae]